jgi:hypothetical protein
MSEHLERQIGSRVELQRLFQIADCRLGSSGAQAEKRGGSWEIVFQQMTPRL